jgi:hypothetical protein
MLSNVNALPVRTFTVAVTYQVLLYFMKSNKSVCMSTATPFKKHQRYSLHCLT